MNEIVYLSRKDRDRLSQIEQMIGVLTPEVIAERDAILSRRKTLQTMTFQECSTMKAEISGKVAKIAAVGRMELARPFIIMAGQLDQRMDTLMRYPQKVQNESAASTNPLKARKPNPLTRTRNTKWTKRVGGDVSRDPQSLPPRGTTETDE